MSVRSSCRAVLRWVRRVHARRKARLASVQRVDERLVEFTQQADRDGVPYDTWRQALPPPRRGGGGMG